MATPLKLGMVFPKVVLQRQGGSNRVLPDPAGPNLLVFYRGDW